MKGNLLQIIDANLNRAKEGLRVIEEVVRFVNRDKKVTLQIKKERHNLGKLFVEVNLLKFREVEKDIGKEKKFDFLPRVQSVKEYLVKNFKRVEESCRVLEELGELIQPGVGEEVKKIRFTIYELEKKVLSPKLPPLPWLYVIIDEKYIFSPIEKITLALCKGGVDLLQLREKTSSTKKFLQDAKKVRKVTQEFNALFVVNDRVDIALSVSADGIHIGKEDISVQDVKKIFSGIIGCSVSSVNEAKKREKQGVDYLSVGSLYPSVTKKKKVINQKIAKEIKNKTHLPVVGIGGITLTTVEEVMSLGLDGVCVSSSILTAKNIEREVKLFKEKVTSLFKE
jgi:thiamine-phosphate pyrophosphorylase